MKFYEYQIPNIIHMLSQPAVTGAGTLGELQFKIYWHGDDEIAKASYLLAGSLGANNLSYEYEL